ncbi:DUF6240 domain-containing protein [Tissierella sp. MB52-C2]|uniref:DUF6240 domain-containing protein n=1 Tax=Tissierella sp. MB52-C2 TaxID=3070999 RepID=UPI00280A71E9|nr:DUF6240 domain-containing protein [Tissierella sp. MB52-C2]WMM24557.1 DUF6240 domain-containing protein [Tissierella sp. MB52-C2]
MEILKINNKDNIINAYNTPTLPYDVEGVLVDKNGKDIKVQKIIDNKTIEYSLRLNEEIAKDIGEDIIVEKENIVSSKVEEKEEVIKEESETRKVADILSELGLEYTEENIRMIEFLLSSGIGITKSNVDSYIKSKEYLNNIVEDIDADSIVKLLDRGIDLENVNLQKINDALEEIKNEKVPFSFKRFLRLEKDLTYKEAEEISKEIYGQKMGKDVYDTIIVLHKEKLPITKENIDKTMDVMKKLYNLKALKEETYVKIICEDKEFNIETLYKLNNSYVTNEIKGNFEAKNFEGFTVAQETSIDSLREILADLNIENNMENINILREFIVNNMTMDNEKYNKVVDMKEAVKELITLLDHGEIINLNTNGVNILEEDIYELVKELKREPSSEEISEPLTKDFIYKIKEELETLGRITDKDLLHLIKNGEDFTIKTIKEVINENMDKALNIEGKTLDKTIYISNIFNTLGEELNPTTVSLAERRFNSITLNNLYMVHKEINTSSETINPVDKISEGLIFEEYIRAKNSLTTNIIRESIKEGKTLEHMEIKELNNYIEKKINRYKESHKMFKEIKDIKGNEEQILPIIMKNQIPMTLKEIKDINLFLNGDKGIANILKDIQDPHNSKYNEEFKENIKVLQEKISESIKNGDDGFKEEYNDLVSLLNSGEKSFDSNEKRELKDEYLSIQRKISKKDIILQLPIEIGNEYKSLNIIVPYGEKGIDKNNMSFYISLETENLGLINIDFNVKGKEVYINLEEDSLINRINILEKSLENLGYKLVI